MGKRNRKKYQPGEQLALIMKRSKIQLTKTRQLAGFFLFFFNFNHFRLTRQANFCEIHTLCVRIRGLSECDFMRYERNRYIIRDKKGKY